MEESMANPAEWRGSLGLALGSHIFCKFVVDAALEDAVHEIAAAVRKKLDRALPHLQSAAAHRMSTPPPPARASVSASSTDSSQASTTPSSPSGETLAAHVCEDVAQFETFLRDFIRSCYGNASEQGAQQHKWRLCSLVLLSFLRDNISEMCAAEDADEREQLIDLYRGMCGLQEQDFMEKFEELLRAQQPPALVCWGMDWQAAAGNGYEACAFVLDKYLLEGLPSGKPVLKTKLLRTEWGKVRATGSDQGAGGSASCFLDRAEGFFRNSFFATILGKLFYGGRETGGWDHR